ncbi:hypothetical protein ACQ4PT_043692 [Festuca glaucescens]
MQFPFACTDGDLDRVKGLEAVLGNMDENDRELVASLSFADFGPLNLAASSGYMVIRKYLVEQLGFDINSDASGHISGLEAVLDNMDENDRELVASLSFCGLWTIEFASKLSGDMNPSVSIVPARSSSGVSDFGAIGDNLSGTYGTSGQATLPIKLAPPPAPEVAEVASSLLPNKPAPAPAPEVAEVAKNNLVSLLQKKPAPAPEVAEVAIMPKKSKNIICLGGLLVLLVAVAIFGLLFVVVCRLKRRKDAGRIRPQTELSGTSTRWQTADEVIRNQHVEIPMTDDAPFLGPVTRARLNSLIKDKGLLLCPLLCDYIVR